MTVNACTTPPVDSISPSPRTTPTPDPSAHEPAKAPAVSRDLSLDQAWALTRAISPRERVRVADVDAYGNACNTYTRTASLSEDRPGVPWAVHLAGMSGDYHLLAFDLDAHRGPAAVESEQLGHLLQAHNIPYVLTESGPTGGRHVWVGLAQPVSAHVAEELVRVLRVQWPTIDPGALLNPRTGCVRAPGAPHRHGGVSRLIAGDLGVLRVPVVPASAVTRLLARLRSGRGEPDHPPPAGQRSGSGAITLPRDPAGDPYVPSRRRRASLTATTQRAAWTPLALDEDASARLWRVLLGATAAGWRFRDLTTVPPPPPRR